jgi:hypothetical protein
MGARSIRHVYCTAQRTFRVLQQGKAQFKPTTVSHLTLSKHGIQSRLVLPTILYPATNRLLARTQRPFVRSQYFQCGPSHSTLLEHKSFSQTSSNSETNTTRAHDKKLLRKAISHDSKSTAPYDSPQISTRFSTSSPAGAAQMRRMLPQLPHRCVPHRSA